MSSTESGAPKTTRRNLLKWGGALAGAVVIGAAGGFGADILMRPNTAKTTTQTTTQTVTQTVTAPPVTISYKPPLSAAVQATVDAAIKQRVDRHAGETVVYAPFSANMGSSGLAKVHIKGGIITAIEPGDDVTNPNIGREDAYVGVDKVLSGQYQNRPSVQQLLYGFFQRDPGRFLYPMKRVGGQKGDPNGQFVRITWDEAISTIVTAVQASKDKYGPYSVMGFPLGAYNGTGTSGWGTVSYESHVFASQYVFGTASIASDSSMDNMFLAKLIVQNASDATASGGTQGSYFLRLAREKGIPVIVIDPVYTAQAEALADQYIAIRAGTDAAFFLGVANVLFKENLYDTAYVNKFVEPTGFAKWKDYVVGNTAGPDGKIDRTPAWAEKICGIPAETITAFARLYASSKPTFFINSWCGGRQVKGENMARLGMYLQAMTGNLGVAGGTCATGRPGSLSLSSVSTPSVSAEYGQVAGTYRSPVLYKNYAYMYQVLEKAKYDQGLISKAEFYAQIGNPVENPVPNTHIRMTTGTTGQVNQKVDINMQREASKLLDLSVAGASHSANRSEFVSDIVLPIAEQYEYEGMFSGIDGGIVYVPKLVDPPGEAKESEWINIQFAKQLGILSTYMPKYTTDADWPATKKAMAKTAYEKWAVLDTTKTAFGTVPSWDDFMKKPILTKTKTVTSSVAFSDNIQKGTAFATKSGKLEFYSDYIAQGEAFLKTTKYGGYIAPMAIWEPQEQGMFDPLTAKFPLRMGSSHNRHKGHEQYAVNPAYSTSIYRHAVWISLADAKARGIKDNDQVRVYSQAGEAILPAYVTSRMTPGNVKIFDAAWYSPSKSGVDSGGAPNTVLQLLFDAIGQDNVENTLVEVEKV